MNDNSFITVPNQGPTQVAATASRQQFLDLCFSAETNDLDAAMLELAGLIDGVSKDATNPAFRKSGYASLRAIQAAIAEPLQRAGLEVSQHIVGKGGVWTRVSHPKSGQWSMSYANLCDEKASPQQAGSAITYTKRYALGGVFNLRIDDDDDGNAASARPLPKAVATPKEKSAPKKKTFAESFEELRGRLTKVEPSSGAAFTLVNNKLKAFGFETPNELIDAGYSRQVEVYKNLEGSLDVWTELKEKANG